mmetsp:Transcript_18099/g.45555  ORF Transcript_18099/g.45555 Transcript_18099/m.45555 type:complete len:85 (+) Transcript_18099:1676-1930(+)
MGACVIYWTLETLGCDLVSVCSCVVCKHWWCLCQLAVVAVVVTRHCDWKDAVSVGLRMPAAACTIITTTDQLTQTTDGASSCVG